MRVAIKDIISTYKRVGKASETATLLGVHRSTVYRWILRGKTLSGYLAYRGVHRKSTRPHHIRYKLTIPIRKEILSLKDKKHIGAKKLHYRLRLPISSRTVHRFLKTKGLTIKQSKFRRPRFQNGFAMRPSNTKDLGCLQMDTKHVTPELSGLPVTVYEYAAIDIVSRYKLAVLLPDISSESARMALEYFLKWFPFKVVYIQTDNGLEYQSEFDEFCTRHTMHHYFIHKNSPNENAVIERSFKTDQEEFYFWLENAPQHIGELNGWLQKFILDYNTWRPHQALEYKTPMEVVKIYLNQSVA